MNTSPPVESGGLAPAPSPTAPDHRYLGNLWKLYAIRGLFWAHFWSAVLTPFFTDWGHLKLSQVLYLNSWFMFCSFALEVPTGVVADFFGRKVSLAIGGAMAAVGVLVYASAPSITCFAVGELLLAIAFTLHSGADEALAFDSLKAAGQAQRAGTVLPRMEAFKLGGIQLGTLLGMGIVQWGGLQWPMRAYSIPALLVTLLALTLKEPPTGEPRATRRNYLTILRSGARYFISHPILRLFTLELAVTNALAWAILWLYQPVLTLRGFPIGALGFVHATACVAQIAFLSHVGRIERWCGSRRRLLILATVGAGVAMILVGVVTSWWILIPAILAAFALSLPRVAIYGAHLNVFIPSEQRATVLSFVSMCRTLAIVVLNPLTGWGADHSLPWTFVILGVLLCLGPLFSRIEERHLAV